MKKHKAQKDILYISISSFVLTVIWISFNIYHAHVSSTIEPTIQLQIEPIEPEFDIQEIQKIKSRKNVIPIYELGEIQIASQESNIQSSNSPVSISTASAIVTDSGELLEITGE